MSGRWIGWIGAGCLWAVLSSGQTPPNDGKDEDGPNRIPRDYLVNSVFTKTTEVAYPWTGVDAWGNLRKAAAHKHVNMFIDRSNQFAYAFLGFSASFVDLDGDGLPDIVSPDGNGMFWFWKNTGKPGEPAFGYGEVMPLLVDNGRTRTQPLYGRLSISGIGRLEGQAAVANLPGAQAQRALTPSEQRQKERIDERRAKERERRLERLIRENDRKQDGEGKLTQKEIEDELEKFLQEEFPYPWEKEAEEAIQQIPLGTKIVTLNGYRQLRAVAAPADWDGNGSIDFLVGDAQGNIYFAQNSGTAKAPIFRTYTKKDNRDLVILQTAPIYNPVTRRISYGPVEFMNYAMPFVIDWNRDGKLDVLVGEGTYSVNSVRFYNNPRGTPPTGGNKPALMVGEERTFLAPFAHDWDGDGHLDLFVNDDKGRLTYYRNEEGRYTNGQTEMTNGVDVVFDSLPTPEFFAYCVPQPCDWNNDGVMDMIWGDPFGYIVYALGYKDDSGIPKFRTPVAVRSTKMPRMLKLPTDVGLSAVPSFMELKGGTQNALRLINPDDSQELNSEGVGPRDMRWFYMLMPGWQQQWQPTQGPRGGRFYPNYAEMLAEVKLGGRDRIAPGYSASWGIAPVPYEVWSVVEEEGPGEGHTLHLRWHNPAENAVFKQARDQMTEFGQGAEVILCREGGAHAGNLNALVDKEHVKISFHYKLDGRFERIETAISAKYTDSKGDPNHHIYGTISQSTGLKTGVWAKYEYIDGVPPFNRRVGNALHIRFVGRGEIRVRDVRVETTRKAPTKPAGR